MDDAVHSHSGRAGPPPGQAGAIPDAVIGQAVDWYVRLASGTHTEQDRAAFAHWRGAHPHHAQAWERLQSMGGRMRGSAVVVAPTVTHAALARAESITGRRRALKSLIWLGGGGAGLYLVHDRLPWRAGLAGLAADVHTYPGERRGMVLADGTQLMLNTATAVDLRFDAHERRILLREGEIMVATAGDPAGRPFVVATPDGTLVPLGTRFTVRHDGQVPARLPYTRLAVTEGAVQVRAADGQASVLVNAGQQVDFSRHAVQAVADLREDGQAWTDGTFAAEGMRLADLLAELGRYRRGVLRCAPEVADLRITGAWPQDGPGASDRILDSLQRRLPVRVDRYTRFWVTVSAR